VQFDEELLNKLEMERTIVDDKVATARYAYIVTRKEYYRKLIKEMEDLNFKITRKVEDSNSLFDDLIKVDFDRNYLYEKVYDIVDNCVKIDGQGL
jgi:hypothetical protein